MSAGNPERFPWGSNTPSERARMLAATLIAVAACLTLYASFRVNPGRHTDFSNAWFGARMLLKGIDPYPLLGPGRAFDVEYQLLYPASSFVAVLPFGLAPEREASLAFVAISVWLLVYAITRDGWHRMPLIASAAFMDSVMAAQWTLILTAALFLPFLAFATPAKPQNGIPVIASARSTTSIVVAGASATVLVIISLVLLPGWPREWLTIVTSAEYVKSPLMTLVGAPVFLLLLRWRRRESHFVFASAALPQTLMWYSSLALLSIGETYREVSILSIISTTGFFAAAFANTLKVPHVAIVVWTCFICTTYLPCVALILMRKNEGPLPAWILLLIKPASSRGRSVGSQH
jgi:hypothetical protein